MNIAKLTASLLAILLTLASCADRPDSTTTPPPLGFDTADLSDTVRPQDDFFAFVNERWLARTPIPDDYTSYGVTRIIAEQTEQQLKALVESLDGSSAGDSGIIQTLYSDYLDTDTVEAKSLAPLDPLLALVDAATSPERLWQTFGALMAKGVHTPVEFYIDGDARDPDIERIYFVQSGLSLPDRDYYLEDTPQLVTTREAYQAHLARMLRLAGWAEEVDAERTAASVLALETKLADISWTRVQRRNRERIYRNLVPIEDAIVRTSGLDWRALMSAASMPAQEEVVLAHDTYFEALPELLRGIPMADWQAYLRWRVLKTYAPFLTDAIVQENFDFEGRTLRGQLEQTPRWRRGIRLLNQTTGELLGKLYVEQHFPEASKRKINELVEDLRAAFAESIEQLDWMSEETKAAATEKLKRFNTKLGYPDNWRDYSGLRLTRGALVANVISAREFDHAYHVGKVVRPRDRGEWGMSPQTVNAYYRPSLNEIVFPAAILQAPLFDPDADDAANYGAIGAVIGHEFSHGFDDQGRKFDGLGRLRDWWQPSDAEAYESRAARLVTQYAAFRPLPDTPINGRLTLGENIADLAGLIMAYRAYERQQQRRPTQPIAGFTGAQRFFIAYALAWRSTIRAERLREILLSDPHSPPRYRVMGTLRNMTEFHEAFDVQPGDGMYVPPSERAQIW